MKNLGKIISFFILSISLLGCSGIGSRPSDNPPQIVSYATNPNDNREVNTRVWYGNLMRETGWDKPSAFGPVPSNLQVIGNALCQQALYQRAIGYHPTAKDLTGQPLIGGGYLCVG